MGDVFPSIKFPELFFGLVAPIGADITETVASLSRTLEGKGYDVIHVKVTDVFQVLESYITPNITLARAPLAKRFTSHIAYGDQIRESFNDKSILAKLTIQRIIKNRLRLSKNNGSELASKVAYILYQFKRKEEIDVLRSVYGRLFFQVSVYSRRGARVDALSRRFASSENTAGSNRFRSIAEQLVQDDENEVNKEFGQRVAKIFHDADLIVNIDSSDSIDVQIHRFCELLFGANFISPTRLEYGMFLAKAAGLRTLDLSRQVGAAIFSNHGEIVSLGSNEVPKGGGGTYWASEGPDDREFVRGFDSNHQRKKEIVSEIINIISPDGDTDTVSSSKEVEESQFMDALEYGRIVHAEMSAILDAARVGHSIRGGVLYCTTFPCHMCAKHIVGSGISRVVFLEPYPKSLAFDLHSDSIQIEGGDRGAYQEYPHVKFEHFYGVAPRRYREMFERNSRKSPDGRFRRYISDVPSPYIDIKYPFYIDLENLVLKFLGIQYSSSPLWDVISSIEA